MYKKIKMTSYTCDNIITHPDGSRKKCTATRLVLSVREEELRKEGWMVTRDKRCYCPSCAPFYRNVGRSGQPRKHIQLKMEDNHGE